MPAALDIIKENAELFTFLQINTSDAPAAVIRYVNAVAIRASSTPESEANHCMCFSPMYNYSIHCMKNIKGT